MADQNVEQGSIEARVSEAAQAEGAAFVEAAQAAITIEAATERGLRSGRRLGSQATENVMVKGLGFPDFRTYRNTRRDDPTRALAVILGSR